jgi:hypothetical protein
MYKNNFLCILPWREYLFIADIPKSIQKLLYTDLNLLPS